MKYQLSLILLICYLLLDCSGLKKHSTTTSSDTTIATNEEILVKMMDDTVVTDIDGNSYPTVLIGNRLWMAANLNVSKYNNGKSIAPYSGGGFLHPKETGMFVFYQNDKTIGEKYGKLYNHYAVQEGSLCPEGWYVPSEEDWQELINTQEENRLKLLLGGLMNPQDIPSFLDLDNAGYWWTTTSVGRNTTAIYKIHSENLSLQKSGANEGSFLSVRCIKKNNYEK